MPANRPPDDDRDNQDVDSFVQKLFYERAFDVTAGALERTRSGAQAISVAAATVASVYSGLLAAAAASERQIPICALLPGLALGACLVYSSNFLVQLGRRAGSDEEDVNEGGSDGLGQNPNDVTLNRFIDSMSERIQSGAYLLRGSILMLGLSVALMPAPFIVMSSGRFREVKAQWPEPPTGDLDPQQLDLYRAQLRQVGKTRDWIPNTEADVIVSGVLVLVLIAAIIYVARCRTNSSSAATPQ